ncbi:GntR family transcriptional regulator [Jannaschia formosa]|uniref:GntR family transcriptional regulator n=1 Tax=Jannaschia formosa TaxID=2259592 RepID=UPI000E1C07ED|nr:GntR family transcriptional regulator [Jannaschia formosa]TFL18908.1 GntR family transcriptional regulator [Jannaschia formosa]
MAPSGRPGNGPVGGKARSVYLSLRGEISSGTYAPGATLPAESKLAASHDVSRVTVRRALAALAAEGLVETRSGAGTTVTEGAQAPLSADIASALPQLAQMGQATTARLLSFAYVAAPAPVLRALDLPEGARVQRATRIRLSEGRPFSHLTTFVPEAIARHYDEADLARAPLLQLLERAGTRIEAAQQSVTATAATPEVAEALGTVLGAPLLSLTRTVRDVEGRGVEYLSALYLPDLFRLDMTLSRVREGDTSHWEPVIGGGA